MANKNTPVNKEKSPLIGAGAQPTVLDKQLNVGMDTTKSLIDNILDAGITGGLDTSELDKFTNISNTRDQIYSLIDTMCADSAVSSIIRTYAENVCEPSDTGDIVWCESDNPKIGKYINYLLGLLNVNKNIYGWTYSLVKYGDLYLRLYRKSDYTDQLFNKAAIDHADYAVNSKIRLNERLDESINLNIHQTTESYVYYVEAVPNPGTRFELTKFGKTFGYIETPDSPNSISFRNLGGTSSQSSLANNSVANYNYKWKSTDVNIYQADDFVHACLEDDQSRYPETVSLVSDRLKQNENEYTASTTDGAALYKVRRGKSRLYDAYKVWREKQLLEGAVLLSRITRSGLVRKVGVEVGDMPKEQVQLTLRRVKELFEQKTAISTDGSFTEYTNPGAIENFIYYATNNGKGQISVDSVGGDFDPKQLTDLDWWNNKFYAAFGIPKQYFSNTDDSTGFNGGTSLSIISSVFAKAVKRVQSALISALTDRINLILINKGLTSYLNNFTLRMKTPLTQEEKDFRDNLSSRLNTISTFQALFNDVETRSRKLEILKDLTSTLHYDDDIMNVLQEEIDDAKKAEAKERAEAEQKEEPQAVQEDTNLNMPHVDLKTEPADNLQADSSAQSTDLEDNTNLPSPDELASAEPGSDLNTNESLSANNKDEFSVFDDTLTEDPDNSLPTPEEADANKDFTKNI